jgi:hypothetical protein
MDDFVAYEPQPSTSPYHPCSLILVEIAFRMSLRDSKSIVEVIANPAAVSGLRISCPSQRPEHGCATVDAEKSRTRRQSGGAIRCQSACPTTQFEQEVDNSFILCSCRLERNRHEG